MKSRVCLFSIATLSAVFLVSADGQSESKREIFEKIGDHKAPQLTEDEIKIVRAVIDDLPAVTNEALKFDEKSKPTRGTLQFVNKLVRDDLAHAFDLPKVKINDEKTEDSRPCTNGGTAAGKAA